VTADGDIIIEPCAVESETIHTPLASPREFRL